MIEATPCEFTHHADAVLAGMTVMSELMPADDRQELVRMRGKVRRLADRHRRIAARQEQ